MKTRMRRFWISVSLAAGSLALPLSGVLRAHDLPTSWTSGANSTGSWNYLTDNCFDLPMLHGNQSSGDVELSGRRGPEDWASSCPAEWAAGPGRANRPANRDYEVLLRNPISRFSKEMTCWVNEWQMIQYSANLSQPAQLWAKLPENGNPPAPDYSVEYVAKYEPVPLADTCAFDAEYQARQTAAELLAREIARADAIAKFEARVSQAVVDAQRMQAIIDLDAIPAKMEVSSLAPQAPTFGPLLCGGESREIMTEACFPKQYSGWKTRLPYVPNMVDEYLSYDLEARDQHWLGGVGRSWKLRSKLGAWPIAVDALRDDALLAKASANEAKGESTADGMAAPAEAPEAFVAPDRVALNDVPAWDEFASEWGDDSAESETSWGYDPAQNEAEIQAYFNGVAIEAQRNALGLLGMESADSQAMLPQAEVLPGLLPDLGQSMAVAIAWVEDQQCTITGELCSLDSVYRLGSWLSEQTVSGTRFIVDHTVSIAHYMDLPTESESSRELFVIYVDAEGNSLAVPSSLARAWNRPEVEATNNDPEEAAIDASYDASYEAAMEPALEAANVANVDWVLLDQVGTQVISTVANRLNSIGMQILQASDLLNSWAETQIASREAASVK